MCIIGAGAAGIAAAYALSQNQDESNEKEAKTLQARNSKLGQKDGNNKSSLPKYHIEV